MAKVWTEAVRSRPNDLFQVVAIGRRWAPLADLYHRIIELRWGWYFATIALGFVTANAVFALLYMAQPDSIANSSGSFRDSFFFSVQTLATIGYGAMAPNTLYAHVLVATEALTGLLGFAVVTGVTFAKFARPRARVLFSRKICVGTRNGQRYVMFRMANERHNQVVEANLTVLLLQDVATQEGERLRVPMELKLVRKQTQFFRLSWTASHLIDESSPFYGPDALEKLQAARTDIYMSLTGMDDTIAQTVHARHAYALEDIVWGARFKDVISGATGGVRVIDYRYFHDVVLEPPAAPKAPEASTEGEASHPRDDRAGGEARA